MKNKVLNLGLILTSLLGYLEWSGDSRSFLFQAELDVISKLFSNPTSAIHPFTILPLIGQLLLLLTLLQKTPSKILTYAGIALLGILLWFMLAIGLISLNFKITLSTIPFTIVVVLTIMYYIKKRPN